MPATIQRVIVAHHRIPGDWGTGEMMVFSETGSVIFGPDRVSERFVLLYGANPVRTAAYTVDLRIRRKDEPKSLLDLEDWSKREQCDLCNMEEYQIGHYHHRTGSVYNATIVDHAHPLAIILRGMGDWLFNIQAKRVRDYPLPWNNKDFAASMAAFGMAEDYCRRNCACYFLTADEFGNAEVISEEPQPN